MKVYNYVIVLLAILLALLGCKQNKQTYHTKRTFPVFVNIETVDEQLKIDTSAMVRSASNVLYIGKDLDTISLNYKWAGFSPFPPPPPFSPRHLSKNVKIDSVKFRNKVDDFLKKVKENPVYPYYADFLEIDKFKSWSKAKVLIRIDTSIVTKERAINQYSDEDIFYQAYPVYIKNEEEDSVIIGYDRFIPLILEAKDSLNQWRPIEKNYKFKCGMGISGIILPPKYVIISSKIIFKGNFKTQLRLKLGNNYSNEYMGYINYSQFNDNLLY
ncbi:hypothetical protein ACG2LH_11370 [Zhouia sp. PK063]|uniref:hypothetical protein n=1 Tax=Zhouia sp. PK063 TaxID=3373602 RepID=UPI0037BD8509